ncbi:MAG: hypothetical protein ABSF89_08715 [Acidimicrobiales bacterium]|jgi:hypothetical protein
MTSGDVARWFDDNKSFFEDMDKASERLLRPTGNQSRRAFELAATWLLAVLVRGEQLPPIPDEEAQRHFAAGLASYKMGAETLARTNDETEVNRAIQAIKASNGEFARMYEALGRTRGSG